MQNGGCAACVFFLLIGATAVDPPFNPLRDKRGNRRSAHASQDAGSNDGFASDASPPPSLRREGIKVLRNKADRFSQFVGAPPCSIEMDRFCGAVLELGGTYEAMQTCLLANLTKLGSECQKFTQAAGVCDFLALRDVCSLSETATGHSTAACVERVAALHARGRVKVPRRFLNFSHSDCADALRKLPKRDESDEVATETPKIPKIPSDSQNEVKSPVEVAVASMSELAEIWALDQAEVMGQANREVMGPPHEFHGELLVEPNAMVGTQVEDNPDESRGLKERGEPSVPGRKKGEG